MRYGGDELIAVIAGRCEADSIMRHIENIISEQQTDFDVSVSCGAHTVKFDRDFDLEAAVKQADRKMYAVKRGKHRT
ncbi:MAG: diguanylate cyclase [Ruminococcus sp.]|nr:diguanylate cyclase [Ruminococcus sp.]